MKHLTATGSPEVHFEPMEKLWDIRSQDRSVLSSLLSAAPELDGVLDELSSGCPIAKHCHPFRAGNYFRLNGHARSFCYFLESGGVLAFKGTEPMSEDYGDVMRVAWNSQRPDVFSPFDHFLLNENEIYLAMTVFGSKFAAEQSWEWISAYFKRFGRLPRTPIPLSVYRIPEPRFAAFKSTILPYLTDRGQNSAVRRFNWLSEDGLGVYVYYYPAIPVRMAHAQGNYPGSFGVGNPRIGEEINFDLEQAVSGWLNIVSEMLLAGYLPTTKVHTGNCLQDQNLAIDGGICDIDSIEKMDRVSSDKEFADALFYSLGVLTNSILLATGLRSGGHTTRGAIATLVFDTIRSRVESEAKTAGADPRLLKFIRLDGVEGIKVLTTLLAKH